MAMVSIKEQQRDQGQTDSSQVPFFQLIPSEQRPTCWVGEEERQCWKRRLCSSHRSLHVEPEMIPFLYWSHWGGKAEGGAISHELHCIHGEPVSSDFMQASYQTKTPFKRSTSDCKATRAVGRQGCCQATGSISSRSWVMVRMHGRLSAEQQPML